MADKKITKKEVFGEMVEIFTEMGRTDLVDFANHELELLAKKASSRTSGTTKTQVENEKIMNLIEQELEVVGKPTTITDLLNESQVLSEYVTENGNKLTNQKVSALMKKLKEERQTVISTTDKRKTYFSLSK
jgi:uncharacterized protein YqeY